MMDVEKLKQELRAKFAESYRDIEGDFHECVNWHELATHVNRLLIEARLEELNDLDIFYSTSFASGKRIEERIAELKERLK